MNPGMIPIPVQDGRFNLSYPNGNVFDLSFTAELIFFFFCRYH